jgi:hypothetical protein
MSADVRVSGILKKASHISYTSTRLGTTYSFHSGGRQVSVQLIRTNGKVEYRNATNLPAIPSPQLRLDLSRISKHFAGMKE